MEPSEHRSDASQGRRDILFSYITGLLSAALLLTLFFLFAGYRGGFSNLFAAMKNQLFPRATHAGVLHLPNDIQRELTERRAPIGNAGNPTKVSRHDTFLVRPDQEIGYVLRPDADVSVFLLRSTKALNLDPPVLHLNRNEDAAYSERLKRYIEEESRLQYSYSTDAAGFRRTVPDVASDRKILITGDSVAFGVGVDDDQTVASHLQRLTGRRYRIINAAVGGYNGQQAFLSAKRLSETERYAGLIYVVCQNDFMEVDDWVAEARDVLSKISTLSERFNNRVMIMLVTYMQYNLRDLFLEKGWSVSHISKTDALRKALPGMARAYGFAYHDWTDDVRSHMNKEKSIFSRFALYSDQAHMSPLGYRLMAAELFAMLQKDSR